VCLSPGTRISTSSHCAAATPPGFRSALLHTSSPLRAQLARRTGSHHDPKKANTLITQAKIRKAIETRPHVVLGNRPGDEDKWRNCDLAKIIVTEEELRSPSAAPEPSNQPIGTVQLPKHMNFGIGEAEKQLLFRHLPVLSARAPVLLHHNQPPEVLESLHTEGQEQELFKASNFAKVVDLRNANAGGIAYENRRRIILAFSTPENPFDPGRVEVQGIFSAFCTNYCRHIKPVWFSRSANI
jgi:small subunit ribosomal protein S15